MVYIYSDPAQHAFREALSDLDPVFATVRGLKKTAPWAT